MIRKRGDRFQVVITRPGGRKEYPGTFETRTRARQVELEELAKHAGPRPDETAGDFALRWVEEYPRPKASTRKLYASLARRFADDLEPVRADNRVVTVSTLKLTQISRPVARAYVIAHPHLHPMLSAMFNDAAGDGLVDSNPFARLGLTKSKGRKRILALTEAEVARLAEVAESVHGDYGPTFAAAILTAAYTGVRPGELAALEWRDLDLKGLEVSVRGRLFDGEWDLPKNGETRVVTLPPPAAAALRAMPRPVGVDAVFTTSTGKALSKGSLGYYWRPVWLAFAAGLDERRRAELEQARGKPTMDFYELRHFCATMLLERGMFERDVAEQLGHTDGGDLVRKLYGHPDKAAARDRLRRAFETPAPLRVAGEGADRVPRAAAGGSLKGDSE